MQAVSVPVFEGDALMRRMTRAEYQRLGELGYYDQDRVELVHGIVVQMPPIGIAHGNIDEILAELLITALHGRARVRVQLPTIADDESLPQPDFAIVPLNTSRKEHPTVAHFVIEVADSSLRFDRKTKAPLYAASGFPEYWIIDVNAKAIEVYTQPVNGEYSQVRRVETEVSPQAFPDLVIKVADLFV